LIWLKELNLSEQKLTKQQLEERYKLSKALGIKQAASEIGISTRQLRRSVAQYKVDYKNNPLQAEEHKFELPVFPDENEPIDTVVDQLENAFNQKLKAKNAKRWFPVKIPSNDPIGIAIVGDPHLGVHCNFSLLKRDVGILNQTEGLFGVMIGDVANNWPSVGRLLQLYADEDISRPTERRLAKWFMEKVNWLIWIHGNHERMNSELMTYLEAVNANRILMENWRVKFRIEFPNGSEVRCDFAHNHKGTSKYNPLMGQMNAALFDEDADLYVAGHHHRWAMSNFELDDSRIVHFGRARGYKWLDDFALVNQFHESRLQSGATITFIIDPLDLNPVTRIKGFVDLAEAAEFLTWKRNR
jgi:hypothetical protein